MFDKVFKKRPQDLYAESDVPRESVSTSGPGEKGPGDFVDTPIPLLTWRSAIMGVFVSMGGFLFGYDTGQISGFLEMEDFLQRYGEFNFQDNAYEFSNVRSGLIVGLVGPYKSIFSPVFANSYTPLALYRHSDWSSIRSAPRGSHRPEMVYQCLVCHTLYWCYGSDFFALRQMVSICDGSLGYWSGSRWTFPWCAYVPG